MTLLIFIIILAVLILVHEFGHFIVARLVGIKVEEFAFGFPPRIATFKKGETNYSLNLVPLGGYVKLLGEDGGSRDHRSFAMKPILSRLLVVVAGVTMNIILAIILLTIGFMIGMTPLQTDPATLGGDQKPVNVITGILEQSPAEKAGLQAGDIIQSIESDSSRQLASITDLQKTTKELAGKNVRVIILRKNEPVTVDVTLGQGEAPLGVGLAESRIVTLSFVNALKTATIETGKGIGAIFTFVGTTLKGLFSGQKVGQEVSGPVGIYTITAQAAKLGPSFLLQLTALLSINLAVLNILPLPALDGGRGLFILLEGIFRRRIVREHVEGMIHTVGFILLLLLLLAITVRDIIRL